jgi:flagellar M-ring protein FliF
MKKLDLNALKARGTELFNGFTTGQKTMLGLAVAAVVIGGYLFTSWSATKSYAPLFSNLDAGDASAMTEELTSRKVPYELADNGTTVLVPTDQVHQLRLDMSSQGLPSGGNDGYALLDKQGITTSEFRQRIDYQRAIEGELSDTIGAIEGVESAKVHLVMPAEDLFANDDTHASASVLIMQKSGSTLTAGQVQAVVHLVASSVEGLDPTNVTVTDEQGRVLAAPGVDGMDAVAGDARSTQRRAFETDLSNGIESLLTPVVGAGKAVVQVAADIDFDKVERTVERFDQPAENAPRVAETATEETYTGTGAGATGVLGVDPTQVDPAAPQNEYNKRDSQTEFAVSKTTEQIVQAPGGIRRLNVAVLLDGSAPGVVDEAAVRDMVATAAGIDEARGDRVSVTAMAFDDSAAEAARAELEAAEAARKESETMALARTAGAVLIVLVVIALAWRSMRKSAAVTRYPLAVPIDVPPGDLDPATAAAIEAAATDFDAELAGIDDLEALPAGEDDLDGLPAEIDLALMPARGDRELIEGQIGALIDKQPEDVAQLLRGWLADRRS